VLKLAGELASPDWSDFNSTPQNDAQSPKLGVELRAEPDLTQR